MAGSEVHSKKSPHRGQTREFQGSVLSSVDSAFLCENLGVLCGFGFVLNLTGEEETEDFAEDAEKIRI
jgi:hypothetical protein